MKKVWQAVLPAFLLALLALGGMMTRRRELLEGFDADGLPIPFGARWVLIAVGAFAVVFAILTAVLQKPRPGYAENFGRGGGVPAILAGALVAAGAAMQVPGSRGSTALLLLWVFGVVAGLCLLVVGAAWLQNKKPFAALHVIPSVFVLALLITRFRGWSMDPVIEDYCYDLFAAISSMLALFYLGGFCFGTGRRRMSVFWNLCAVYFCPIAMVGAGWADVLLLGGLFLFHLQAGMQLLWPERAEQ